MDEIDNKLARMARARDEVHKRASEKFREDSKKRLAKIVSKKIKTAFIGALDMFERAFGDIWGHGLTESQCTNGQLDQRDIWSDVRNDILNNGNNQIRAVTAELDLHTTSWDGYTNTINMNGDNKDG